MVERDYFFYLSFENSICTDYVTEKFFGVMQRKIGAAAYLHTYLL
jgi:alpha-1,3-fucosyltransferase